MQDAIRLGIKIDVGHKPGYEFWRTRNAAEQLHWTQNQYNDFMNREGVSMYRYEDHEFNISHKGEDPSDSLAEILKEMTEYQEQQEASGEWQRNDDETKQSDCKSD